jgi:hypothetical protein
MRTGYRRRSINRWLLLLKLQLLAIIIGLGALCTSDTSSMSAQNDVSRAADTSGTVSDNANVGRAFGGAFGIVPFSPLGSAQNGAAGVASLLNPRPLEINRQNTHDGLSILADAAILSENAGDFTTNTAPQASGGITALLAPGDGAVQASDGGTATPRPGRQLFSVTDIQPPNYRQSAGASNKHSPTTGRLHGLRNYRRKCSHVCTIQRQRPGCCTLSCNQLTNCTDAWGYGYAPDLCVSQICPRS